MSTRLFAFNGIRFQAPAEWELGALGPEYLRLDSETGPALEVKWQRNVKDPLDKRGLAKLAKRVKSVSGVEIEQAAAPKAWKKALKGFEASAFSWSSPRVRGRGAALYCPECRTFTLIQFYSTSRQVDDARVLAVLDSFRDHSGSNEVLWAVYDIQATVPADFQLAGFTFQPGLYELNFKRKGLALTLHRFAPARVMLKDHDLEALGRARYAEVVKHLDLAAHITEEGRVATLGRDKGPSLLFSIWSRLLRKPSRALIRLVHLPDEDRILAVKLEGRGRVDENLFIRICSDYGIVPQEEEGS